MDVVDHREHTGALRLTLPRRDLIALIGGVAVTWPLAAAAQQPERVRRIGALMPTAENDAEGRARVAAFVDGLREVGLNEGRDLRIDYRWGGTDVERLRTLASELVALTPGVLLAGSSLPLAALRRATTTTPHHIRVGFRSGRSGLCRELGESGRQYYRVRQL